MDNVRPRLLQHQIVVGEPILDTKTVDGTFSQHARQVANTHDAHISQPDQACKMLLRNLASADYCGPNHCLHPSGAYLDTKIQAGSIKPSGTQSS
jgi:hypothetical protein